MSRQDANAAFALSSFLYGPNAPYIEDLYARYEADPKSVDAEWQAFFGGFDGYILSYEHGAMKPEGKLYEVVEQKTGQQREKIIYLDDRPENIAAGAARGWQVVLQETPAKTRAALVKAGLLD